jgi:hypothetical protein
MVHQPGVLVIRVDEMRVGKNACLEGH